MTDEQITNYIERGREILSSVNEMTEHLRRALPDLPAADVGPLAIATLAVALSEELASAMQLLIYYSMQGLCPFCAANTDTPNAALEGVKRGRFGPDLRAFIQRREAELVGLGINPATMHRTDCKRPT